MSGGWGAFFASVPSFVDKKVAAEQHLDQLGGMQDEEDE